MSDARALAELTQDALRAAIDGDLERVEALGTQWEAAFGALPADPAPEERPFLEAALHAQDLLTAELARCREASVAGLRHVDGARRAAAGYARAAGSAGRGALDAAG